jgi:hypothetical protein
MTRKFTRRQLLMAGVLVIVAGVLWVVQREEGPAAAPQTASNQRGAAAQQSAGTIPVEDVKLELLQGERAELSEPERNPFRFQPKAPPPAPASGTGGRAGGAAPPPPEIVAPPPLPPGPPPIPPIPIRFIGLVEAPTQAGRIAILSDGRGAVLYGKEGDIIEGRYRLLRVAPDAIDMAYTDGRGRQTLRLSGQQ